MNYNIHNENEIQYLKSYLKYKYKKEVDSIRDILLVDNNRCVFYVRFHHNCLESYGQTIGTSVEIIHIDYNNYIRKLKIGNITDNVL